METYQKQSSAVRWGLTAVLAGLIAFAGNVCGFAETGAETTSQNQPALEAQGLERPEQGIYREGHKKKQAGARFRHFLKNHPEFEEKMDANQDGQIDRQERRAAFQEWRENYPKRRYDRDNNPPGPRGGRGSNWEREDYQEFKDRVDVNHDGDIERFEKRRAHKYFNGRHRDFDNNPPGKRGGPGTNWENRPGPQGEPGASPDRGRRAAKGRVS